MGSMKKVFIEIPASSILVDLDNPSNIVIANI